MREVLAREALSGTQVAANASGVTWGDHTLEPFNSTFVPNTQTPLGELDVDWFTDLSGTPGPHPLVYPVAKVYWTFLRLLKGMPLGNWFPYMDAGEGNADRYAMLRLRYSDIFTPEFMAKMCKD